MEIAFIFFGTLFGLYTLSTLWKRWRRRSRIQFIQRFTFPRRPARELKHHYPFLSGDQILEVMEALREYFIICLYSKREMVGMPSRAVDIAWHEFILETRHYHAFCQGAFGRFFHHTPSGSMPESTTMDQCMRRAWFLSCARESINPHDPAELPILFAIDEQLSIPDGYTYSPEWLQQQGGRHSSAGGCGGGDYHDCKGDHDNTDDSGGSDGCSGGCGGD